MTTKKGEEVAAKAKPADKHDFKKVELTNIEKTSAEHLTKSWQTVPHIVQYISVEATELINVKELLKDELDISYNDLLAKLLAITLKHHPRINATMEDGELNLWKNVNISIAVETDKGLTVPVINNVGDKSLLQIHEEIVLKS